jgi:hypothetical protein
MKSLKLALAGALMLCAITPASTRDTLFIKDDPGGKILDFVKKYSDMRDAGTRVVVDGDCISACTLIIGMLRPENVCATPNATFGFHSAFYRFETKDKKLHFQHSPEMSELMWNTYPGDLRAYLADHGWSGPNLHPQLILLNGQQLQKFVRACTSDDLS